MHIRPYQQSDLPEVLAITLAAWEPIFTSFHELLGQPVFEIVYPDWKANKLDALASQCRSDHGETVLVAEIDGKVAGFIIYYCNATTHIGEISHNAVAPAYQNHGIATAMYAVCLEEMKQKGMKCASVNTGGDASHAPARRAYEKAGFDKAIPGVTYFKML